MARIILPEHPPQFDFLELWTGKATEHDARVYARVPRDSLGESARWSGTLRGPFTQRGNTLPATFHFRDLGPGPTVLAECLVTDPCYWFPGEPFRYELIVELRAGSESWRYRQDFAIRPLSATARDFRLSRKRWVPRGIYAAEITPSEVRAWIQLAAVPIVSRPSEELLRHCLVEGLPIMVAMNPTDRTSVAEVWNWSRTTCVVATIWPGTDLALKEYFPRKPRLLLGQPRTPDRSREPDDWTDFHMVGAKDLEGLADRDSSGSRPIVVQRTLTSALPLAEMRAACDQLQRDMAPIGDFAGYVVTAPP